MFATQQVKEGQAIPIPVIHSANQGAGVVNTNAIDMSKFYRLQFVIDLGTVSAGGTLDFKLQQGAKSDSSDMADFSPAVAITQMTVSNKTATIEIRAEQLGSGKQYVRGVLTIGVNNVQCVVIAEGYSLRFKPDGIDDASVTQRVAA